MLENILPPRWSSPCARVVALRDFFSSATLPDVASFLDHLPALGIPLDIFTVMFPIGRPSGDRALDEGLRSEDEISGRHFTRADPPRLSRRSNGGATRSRAPQYLEPCGRAALASAFVLCGPPAAC